MAQSSFKTIQDAQESADLSLLNYYTVVHHILNQKGKMKFYLHANLIILFYLGCRSSSVEIKPELQRNVLKFGYGINDKYVGMLAHSFDRFYVVTKFILPTVDNLKL